MGHGGALAMLGCISCDPRLQSAILEDRFGYRMLTIPLPLIAGSAIVAAAVYCIMHRRERGAALRLAPVALGGTLIGLGLGGFLDGILLHQILQVHQMISNQVPTTTLIGKGVNMFWDGIFHVGAFVLTSAGVMYTWRLVGRRDVLISGAAFLWMALLGWGAFNILDSIANHFVFRYHDVVQASANPMMWNIGFLLLGIVQAAAGWIGTRRAERRARASAGSAMTG